MGWTDYPPGAGTVDRAGVLCACKTPPTDYNGSGWSEIVGEIRGPKTYSPTTSARAGTLDGLPRGYYTWPWGLPMPPSIFWDHFQTMTVKGQANGALNTFPGVVSPKVPKFYPRVLAWPHG